MSRADTLTGPPGPFAPLAQSFPTPDAAAWVELARKTLKGAPLEALERRTVDGLVIHPLYTAVDAPRDVLAPRTVAWDIRALVPAGRAANAEALAALEGGAHSLLVDARDGGAGLPATLEGVLTDVAPVALDAGFAGFDAARALDDAAKAAPAAPLAFHLDPLSAFAQAGISPAPIDALLAQAADFAASRRQTYPKASFFLASGAVAHEAGASAAQEIAFAAAAAVADLRALETAGVPPAESAALIVVGLTADAEPLPAIAKLRAARRIMKRVFSATGTDAEPRIEVRSSQRMLTRSDAWTNLVRLTIAAFAAAVGGADAIVLHPFDEAATATPSALARRQTRNIQLVLAEESGLKARPDPAAGSFALEALSADLARAAWARFQAIEAGGGLIAALQSGAVAEEVARARRVLASEIAAGERRIVGVTDFKADEPAVARAAAAATPAQPISTGDDCVALEPIRLEDLA